MPESRPVEPAVPGLGKLYLPEFGNLDVFEDQRRREAMVITYVRNVTSNPVSLFSQGVTRHNLFIVTVEWQPAGLCVWVLGLFGGAAHSCQDCQQRSTSLRQ